MLKALDGFKWRFFFIPLFIGGVAFGIFLWTETANEVTEAPVKTAPQEAKAPSPPATEPSKEIEEAEATSPAETASEEPTREIASEPEAPKTDLKALAKQATEKIASVDETPLLFKKGSACAPVEFRGESPDLLKVDKKDWANLMREYHWAKRELVAWLKKNGKDLPKSSVVIMENAVKDLRIERPPAAEEPDLSWRGIGVWTAGEDGKPRIRVGEGFITLLKKNPKRARFELTRLVAQAWSPCELRKSMVFQSPWTDYLKCMGVEEGVACGSGSYSESGWAVSTALASLLATPGCEIPAFQTPSAFSCVRSLSAKTDIALWKEDRR